jgi:hypothetical protein
LGVAPIMNRAACLPTRNSPDVQKARAKCDRAQKAEEKFHKDFDGIDFTIYFFGIKVRFASGGAGFLSLILPRKYGLVLWGFTLSKAAMP